MYIHTYTIDFIISQYIKKTKTAYIVPRFGDEETENLAQNTSLPSKPRKITSIVPRPDCHIY